VEKASGRGSGASVREANTGENRAADGGDAEVCHALCVFDDILAANRSFAEGFDRAGLAPRAARQFALVTCMDTRVAPLEILGLQPGDAKILRNAGGRVTPDVLRSLILATWLLDVRRIAVMQHTRCALASRTDSDVIGDLTRAGADDAASWEFLAMPDPDDSLRQDVASVRACPLLAPDVEVTGWRYDVDTGAVAVVVP
jgi:carbonic anhydrase